VRGRLLTGSVHVESLQSAGSPAQAAGRLAAVGAGPARGLCWLDGEAAHADGRFSYLAVEPVERIERALEDASPLAAFDVIEREVLPGAASSVDAAGWPSAAQVPRWAGFVAYDATWAGRTRRLPRAEGACVLSFARYDAWLVFEHASGRAWLAGDDAAACARLRRRLSRDAAPVRPASAQVGAPTSTEPARHLAAIASALEHIARGDLYQVNLARCFAAPFAGEPLALFDALRRASPVPFGCYFEAPALSVAARTM